MKLNSQLFCDVCGLPDEKNNLRADVSINYLEKVDELKEEQFAQAIKENETKNWGGKIFPDVHDACAKRVEEYLMENVVKPRKKI